MKRPPLLPLLAAALLFVALVALCVRDYYPPLARPLALDLVLDRAAPGQSDPLIVSGRVSAGDFLWVRHIDDAQIVFCYDSWAIPGLVSPTPVRFTPGVPLHLVVELPAFTQLHESLDDPPGRVRVRVNGAVVFEAPVNYYKRAPTELWIGENPLGGTACGPRLHGRVLRPDGRELRGSVRQFFTLRDRLAGWFRHSRQVYALALLCGALALGWIPLAWFRPAALRTALASTAVALQPHRWFFGATLVSALIFAWMITQGTFDFFRPEPLGSFYDFQMASFLRGRLDVPDEAIGGEAFVFGGKIYGYFGPTPALLRLPFVLCGFAFGELARGYLLAYFVASLVAGYLLLRQALRLVGAAHPPSPTAVVLLVVNAGLGSTLFFLASRAYVYHEAILCGAMFALFSCHFALRHLETPASRWWRWALLCGLLSLHARPPTGLFALTFLGCVSLALLVRALSQRTHAQLPRHAFTGVLCVVGVLTFNGLSYLKFKTFDGAPLRYSRPYDTERLAKIDGRSFHAANIPYCFHTYLIRPNLRLETRFPYLYLGSHQPRLEFPRAKMDLTEQTLALPCSMPALFLLATLGCAGAFVATPQARTAIAIVWIAVLPMSLALFAAVATAHRYTGDFVPFLLCAATFALAAIDHARTRLRSVLLALLALVTTAAVLLTFVLTLHHQRDTVWGVPDEVRANYQHLRDRVDATLGRPSRHP